MTAISSCARSEPKQSKMKKVIIALALAAVCSCMGPDHIGNADGNLPVYIEGTVSSEELDPLKHIRITVSFEGEEESSVVYTSSKGIFRTDRYIAPYNLPLTICISIDDIDGEENGGLYSPLSDKITIFREDIKGLPVIKLAPAYRLTRATASESSQQVL